MRQVGHAPRTVRAPSIEARRAPEPSREHPSSFTGTSASHPLSEVPARPARADQPIQRTIHIGGQRLSNRQFKAWKQARPWLTVRHRQMLNEMHKDRTMNYEYDRDRALHKGLRSAVRRENWYANGPPGQGHKVTTLDLSPRDPEYQRIQHQVMEDHRNRPYATDALHETGSLMGSWMHQYPEGTRAQGLRRGLSMGLAALSPSTWVGKNPADDTSSWWRPWSKVGRSTRPSIEMTGLKAIRNPDVIARYGVAKTDIENRHGHANERALYSGHGSAGMDFIEKHGHDPSYGPYDGSWMGKGHGAHGRGAYFTDRVDKAVSYSAKDQARGEERSFFMQDVLLGNAHTYQNRGTYRRRHHNEMVRPLRNPGTNKVRADGDAAPVVENMGQYDSLIGQETTDSGAGLMGTVRRRNAFDSTEYMVRNADQVNPRYRVKYRLA